MSEQMKTVPFSELLSTEAFAKIKMAWVEAAANSESNPVMYLNDVVTGLIEMELAIKTSAASLKLADWELLSRVDAEPSPAPGTPTQTAPASHGEIR